MCGSMQVAVLVALLIVLVALLAPLLVGPRRRPRHTGGGFRPVRVVGCGPPYGQGDQYGVAVFRRPITAQAVSS